MPEKDKFEKIKKPEEAPETLPESKEVYLERLERKLEEKKPEIIEVPKKEKVEEKREEKEIKLLSERANQFKELTGQPLEEITQGKKLQEMSEKEKGKTTEKLFKYPPYPEQIGKEEIQEPLLEEVKIQEKGT